MRTRSHVAWLLAVLPALTLADGASTHFLVGATVAPRVSLTALSAPDLVQITGDDLVRGYIDVAATYRVATNDRRGYLLQFAARSGFTDAIDVRGLGGPLPLGGLGTESLQSPVSPVQDYALSFRLHLSPGTPAGAYPLPVLVNVATL